MVHSFCDMRIVTRHQGDDERRKQKQKLDIKYMKYEYRKQRVKNVSGKEERAVPADYTHDTWVTATFS